jgi:phosphoglycolate phosphatase-like HAD superfamily hydrolase
MTKKNDLFKARFLVNMGRVGALAKLLNSDVEQLQPTGFAQYEGTAADIFRFVTVFLHATFETLVRSQTHQPNKKWSFYSGADIDKALRQSRIDAKPFKDLYPPLTQLAKRRKRIVHDADFSTSTDTIVEKWGIDAYWQLLMWHLAVVTFYYRLLIVTGAATESESKMHEQLGKATILHVVFGRQLVAFAETPPELRIEALQRLSDTLQTILVTLKWSTNQTSPSSPP